MLEESEAFISGEEPKGNDDEEEAVQCRLEACEVLPVALIINLVARLFPFSWLNKRYICRFTTSD